MKTTNSHTAASADSAGSLRAGRLGVTDIVFFVVAAAAPLVAMTGALPPSIALGNGAAVPGTYVLVGLILLLFSVGYAAMSHRVTNAGAFFAYVGRGLGAHMGTASAFVSILAYVTMQLSIYGFFGGLIASQLGVMPWWAWTGIAWVLVTVLSLFQVDVGAKILGTFMLLELSCLVILSIAILRNGGPQGLNFAASFSPSAVLAGGVSGAAGIAFAFAFASFIGFEATAIYGEESREPKKTVPRATYLAVCVITAIFALTTFAVVTGLGASHVVDRVMELSTVDKVPLTDPAAVVFYLATQYVGGWLAKTMGVLVLSSLFAGLLAFQNSTSRYLFALSRGGALPHALQRVNALGAPANAAALTSVLAGAVIGYFALAGLDPVLNMFFWFSGLAVVAIVFIEILVCVAVVRFFTSNTHGESRFVTLVSPVLAAIGLVAGEYMLMARFALLTGMVPDGVDPTTTTWALNNLGWLFMLSPFLVFVLGYGYAFSRHRQQALASDVLA